MGEKATRFPPKNLWCGSNEGHISLNWVTKVWTYMESQQQLARNLAHKVEEVTGARLSHVSCSAFPLIRPHLALFWLRSAALDVITPQTEWGDVRRSVSLRKAVKSDFTATFMRLLLPRQTTATTTTSDLSHICHSQSSWMSLQLESRKWKRSVFEVGRD